MAGLVCVEDFEQDGHDRHLLIARRPDSPLLADDVPLHGASWSDADIRTQAVISEAMRRTTIY